MRWAWVILGSVAALSCSSRSGALGVTVTFGPNSRAQCVRVVVKSRSGNAQESTAPLPRGSKPALHVGIVGGRQLSGEVTVEALGYVAPDCAEASFNEETAPQAWSLDVPTLQQVGLELDGPAAAVDEDGDHYRAGPDCLDTNAAVHPGQIETLCSDGLDNDCAGGTDCADSACAGMPCDDGSNCTSGDVCAGGVCAGTDSGCMSPGVCEKAGGMCVARACVYLPDVGAACGSGLSCRADRSCVPGEANCADGVDNDGDGLLDCADPDCADQPCGPGSTCLQPPLCASGVCGTPEPVACADPSGICLAGATCFLDAGCRFTRVLDAGTACAGGRCLADGGCVAPETGAACANGVDDDFDGLVDCADPDCNGASCEDGDACTIAQQCSNGRCDGGATVVCNSPADCQLVGLACLSDGGCSYPQAPIGSPCDGGFCSAGGTCGSFPYVPSNFVPAPFAPDASVFLNCLAYVNTDNAVDPIEGWCGPRPSVSVVTQAGGPELLVLSTRDLTQVTGSTVYVYGSRPVVFAVYGNAKLGGFFAPLLNPDGGGWPAGHSLPPGAGAGPQPWCSGGTGMSGAQLGATSGGGGGGAFGSSGADGGDGAGAAGSQGGGGVPNGNEVLVPLRGGCAGGNGGPTSTDRGGVGGGAIQISVAGRLTLDPSGRVGSPGYGGVGGTQDGGLNGGGSGAGSGGAVLIEALHLLLLDGGFISTNGAGGGEGDGDNSDSCCWGASANRATVASAFGGSGADGPATGGPGGSGAGTDGGGGLVQAAVGLPGASGVACGGGGGGGVGRVRLNVYGTCTIGAGVILTGALTSNRTSCP